MIATPASMRRVGWVALLALCCAALFGLSLKVNALKSEVRQTENRILAVRRETNYLETEYETRSNQQQLASWNAVDFGYVAPGPGQYLENVRQLAALGKPLGPDAPSPIRVAQAPKEPEGILPEMVSPLTGKPIGDEEDEPASASVDHDKAAASLGERLAKAPPQKIDKDDAEGKPAKTAKPKAEVKP